MSICVLYLCVYPRSGYGPVDFIDPWFLISGFIAGPIRIAKTVLYERKNIIGRFPKLKMAGWIIRAEKTIFRRAEDDRLSPKRGKRNAGKFSPSKIFYALAFREKKRFRLLSLLFFSFRAPCRLTFDRWTVKSSVVGGRRGGAADIFGRLPGSFFAGGFTSDI